MNINILDYFEASVKRGPDKTAAIDSAKQYSYLQLMEYAKNAAMLFLEQRRAPIIVLCKRDVRCLTVFWGVIYSGNFYVPLDEKIPMQRLKAILSNTEAKIMVLPNTNKIIEDYCMEQGIRVLHFDECFKEIQVNEETLSEIRRTMLDMDPLYMVYTSGSTGQPKGVLKTHRSMISFLNSFQSIFHLQEEDVLGNQAAFDFDVAAKDIFLSMYVGGTIVVIPQMCFLVPLEMIHFLNRHGVTVLIWAAAGIRYLANSKILARDCPKFLRKVFFSGEVLQMSELKEWYHYLPHVEYVNLYAPTESTGNCMYYIASDIEKTERLPLGVPFPNMEVFIVNDDAKPVAENEIGEIYIRGAFLAQGYYNDSEKTKAGFVQNPMHNNYPDIVYKTGDLAVRMGGAYYYVGRTDNQIKYQGHRIELDEIEQVLYHKTEKVRRCCAIYDKEDNQIVFVLEGEFVEDGEIKKLLMEALPKYMIPSVYVWVDKMPENARGKLDREAVIKRYKERKDKRRVEDA